VHVVLAITMPNGGFGFDGNSHSLRREGLRGAEDVMHPAAATASSPEPAAIT